MIAFEVYMIRDSYTGRWHNYGGLTEWLPADSERGGTIWYDKHKALAFAADYPIEIGIDAQVVTFEIKEAKP